MADLASSLTTPFESSPSSRWTTGLLMLIATIAIRWHTFGDPNYHIDEGFYLLVGERMHDGLLPYVDIWDRKPFGLFILYWLVTAFGDVMAYQIAAGLCVWLTAWIIATIVARLHPPVVAITSGVIYMTALEALAGGGGQSPVFYNLPIAMAGWLTLNTIGGAQSPMRKGIIAMLLCGIAMTIKPTSLFEGVFFGVVLCLQAYRFAGWPYLFKAASAFQLTALLPTALCFALFFALGHSAAYFDATVTSIFATAPDLPINGVKRIQLLAFILAPLVFAALGGLALSFIKNRSDAQMYFSTGWLIAAIAGFLAVPNYFDHYALPLASILAIAASPTFSVRIVGPVAAATVACWMLFIAGYPQLDRTQRSIADVDRAGTLIRSHLGNGCLFAYDVPAVLYRASQSCLPTSRVFSEHLSNMREAKSIGVDPVAEVRRILANRPTVIAIAAKPTLNTPNRDTLKMMRQTLAAEYRLLETVSLRDFVARKPVEIWVRKK